MITERECGRRSGFPACCGYFYTRRWNRFSQGMKARYGKMLDKKFGGPAGWNYIVCPRCARRRRIVKVLHCREYCNDHRCQKFD